MLWLWLLLVLGLAARWLHIGRQPFWLDEVFTYQRVQLGLGALVADSLANRHLPNYYLMLQWLAPPDAGYAALRMPSAWFGTLSVGVVFAIAHRVGGRAAAVIAGLLMALSPAQVQYGQEARSYALVVLLIAVALWGLVRLALPERPGADRAGWIAYTLGTIGALDVLGDTLPWLLASNLALYFVWRARRETPWTPPDAAAFRRGWLLSQLAALVCCAPFYVAILAASDGQMLHKFDWVPALGWHNLWVAVGSTYLMRSALVVRMGLLPTAVALLAPVVALLGGVGWFRLRKRLDGRVLLLGFAVLPLSLLAISLFKPVLVPRYILWSAAPFFVLAGVGAAALPRRIAPMAVAGLLLMGAVNLLPLYRLEVKPRWDLAASTLATRVRPGDTVLTADPNAPSMLRALQPKQVPAIEASALVTDRLDVALARWRQGSRVWAVNGRSALGRGEDLVAFEARLNALGVPAARIRAGKEITILVFPAPGAAAAVQAEAPATRRVSSPGAST
ncbi:glycosyltransferase family 39 protein [Frateuria defendens]|uniref:glycosyltransferase family 39 protein n=1 Tax=Frateuria defendens TaxID=2219559 RepID=UPI00066FC65A|nr:glycosyltransferase family 39 protein [Frateuria defendens]